MTAPSRRMEAQQVKASERGLAPWPGGCPEAEFPAWIRCDAVARVDSWPASLTHRRTLSARPHPPGATHDDPLETVKETRATAVAEEIRDRRDRRRSTAGPVRERSAPLRRAVRDREAVRRAHHGGSSSRGRRAARQGHGRRVRGVPRCPVDRHPLAYTREALDGLQAAIDTRTAGRFDAASEERAALATGTFGAGRVWGSNVLAGPRLLHSVAGVPTQRSDAIYAQYPVLTLPSAGASVAENITLAEFASSTAGSVTLARYGRWTDLSKESMIGADAGAITAMHRIGIAKDLDKALIGLVNTAAGGAVAFTADVPAAIRKAMAGVIDATAAADVSEVTILVNPADASLLQSVTPVGGETIGEAFQDFSGALVYPSSAVPTGFMLVAP